MFKHAKRIIYLKRNAVEIIHPGKESNLLKFTNKAADDLEIINKEKFEQEFLKFLVAENIKPSSATLVVSEEHLFEKVTLAKTGEEKEKDIKDFLEEVPFPPEKIEYRVFDNEKGTKIVALNKEYYSLLQKLFDDNKWKVKGVVMESIFDKGPMNQDKAESILSSGKKINKNNLLSKEKHEKQEKKRSKFPILGFLLVLSILTVIFAGGFYLSKKYDKKSTSMNKENDTEVSARSEYEETINELNDEIATTQNEPGNTEIDKTRYKIRVLNGTGVAGLAGDMQEELGILGYEGIEIGNASNKTDANTVFEYSSELDAAIVGEITNFLRDQFENVSVTETTSGNEGADFDIIIVTGKLLIE